MKVTPLAIAEVLLIEPAVYADGRGFFLETHRASRYAEAGMPESFVQDNISWSRRGVLRGLHAQYPHGQDKLVQVLVGEIFDVAVDIRVDSPTFGRWVSARLSAQNHYQLFIPRGFLHGFCVLGEEALVQYKCTDVYAPKAALGVRYDDPQLAIEWPLDHPVLSEADAMHPHLSAIAPERLPTHA